MMKCAVGPYLRGTMHSDRTTMMDEQAWSDLSIWVKVNECHYYK